MGYLGYNAKKDGNQNPIVAALVAAGVKVRDLSGVGGGVTDLLTLHKGVLRLIEIKNPKGRGKRLTKLQEKFREVWPVHIVENAAEALAAHKIGIIDRNRVGMCPHCPHEGHATACGYACNCTGSKR